MEYKGYTGTVHYNDEKDTFYGNVLGLKMEIVYCGNTVQELVNDFHRKVDYYLVSCENHGHTPEKADISNEVIYHPEENSFEYKGYIGNITYSEELQIYHGQLQDIRGRCGYSGMTLTFLLKDFQCTVEEYIAEMDWLSSEDEFVVDCFMRFCIEQYGYQLDDDICGPYIIREARLQKRDPSRVYTVEEIKTLLRPVFKKHGIRLAFLMGAYAKGTADGSSSVELLLVFVHWIDPYGLYDILDKVLAKDVHFCRCYDLDPHGADVSEMILLY